MKTFKVLQFNMQYGQAWDDTYPDHAPVNLDLTISEIRSHDADIVLLQELEQAGPGGAQANPPPNYTRLRAALAGYDGYFAYPEADPRELPLASGSPSFRRLGCARPCSACCLRRRSSSSSGARGRHPPTACCSERLSPWPGGNCACSTRTCSRSS